MRAFLTSSSLAKRPISRQPDACRPRPRARRNDPCKSARHALRDGAGEQEEQGESKGSTGGGEDTWYAKQNPPTAPVKPAIHIDGTLICGSRDVPAAILSVSPQGRCSARQAVVTRWRGAYIAGGVAAERVWSET